MKSLKISRLFNRFDYEIQLPEAGEYLILTGPNGYGKTTILDILNAINGGDLLYFNSLLFKEIEADYGFAKLHIQNLQWQEKDTHNDGDTLVGMGSNVRCILTTNTLFPERYDFDQLSPEQIREYQRLYDKDIEHRPAHIYQRIRMFDHKSVDEAFTRIKVLNEISLTHQQKDFLLQYNNILREVKFVPSQRLYITDTRSTTAAILHITEDFSDILSNLHYKFLKNAQKSDTEFIYKLLGNTSSITKPAYNDNKKELQEVINKARHYDLLQTFEIPDFREDKADILACYINEAKEKLKVVEEPLKDFELFTKLLKKKVLVNKHMEFSRRAGLRFLSGDRSHYIPLEKLSSGEKNEIIMLHDFIFGLPNGSVLLIDEPEISLHVAWQHQFIRDIEEIAELKQFKVIIATHSPQIIGGRWDDCYDLKEHDRTR